MVNKILKTLIFLKLIEAYKNSVDPGKLSAEAFEKIWPCIRTLKVPFNRRHFFSVFFCRFGAFEIASFIILLLILSTVILTTLKEACII